MSANNPKQPEVMEAGKFTQSEAALLGKLFELRSHIAQHNEILRDATGFDGIEKAANEQDAIMDKLPAFLADAEALLNGNVDHRIAARKQALEEAAKVADAEATKLVEWIKREYGGSLGVAKSIARHIEAELIAYAIRALIDKETGR